MYYNNDVKERFLHELEACDTSVYTIKALRTMFKQGASSERRLHKDLAEMTIEEFSDACLKDMMKRQSRKNCLGKRNQYAQWCVEQSLFVQVTPYYAPDQLPGFDDDARQTLYGSFDELKKDIMRAFPEPNRSYTPSLLCLAWLGVPQQTASTLLSSDVDLENGRIYNELYYPMTTFIPISVMRFMRKCKYIGERTPDPADDTHDMTGHDYFVFGHDTCKDKNHIARREVANANVRLEKMGRQPKLLYAGVRESGAMARIYELEKAGVDVTSTASLELVRQAYQIVNKFDFSNVRRDYRQWKRSFHPDDE